MKVILQKSVDKLGHPGDVVEVADGYARNYLMPRGLAVKATRGGVKHVDSLKRAHSVRVNEAKEEAEQVASRLASTPIKVKAHAGEEGKLFGSSTASDTAQGVEKQRRAGAGGVGGGGWCRRAPRSARWGRGAHPSCSDRCARQASWALPAASSTLG